MASRVTPLSPGESPDAEVNQLLADGRDGWWEDSAVFGSFFAQGSVEPHIHEMMRLKTGQINDCCY